MERWKEFLVQRIKNRPKQYRIDRWKPKVVFMPGLQIGWSIACRVLFVSRLAKHNRSTFLINSVTVSSGNIALLKYESNTAARTGVLSNVLCMGEHLIPAVFASWRFTLVFTSVTLVQLTPSNFRIAGPKSPSDLMLDIPSSKHTTKRRLLWISDE